LTEQRDDETIVEALLAAFPGLMELSPEERVMALIKQVPDLTLELLETAMRRSIVEWRLETDRLIMRTRDRLVEQGLVAPDATIADIMAYVRSISPFPGLH
jgi:hypothetical protein